ncbi:right-handed parallel beta-helix repeat-containing protein [Arthrobacter sp. TMS1-12-1]
MIERNRRVRGRRLGRAVLLGTVVLVSAAVLPAPPRADARAAVAGAVVDSSPSSGRPGSWSDSVLAESLGVRLPQPEADPATGAEPPDRRTGAGSAPLGSTAYAIPDDALFVSRSGSNSARGTRHSPLRTIKAAVRRAVSGQTIVVRAGSYHEQVKIPTTKRITLQSYPGEEVWLDGSRRVRGFEPEGRTFVAEGWTVEFDASPTYARGRADGTTPGWTFVNDERPMASHPDQVWIDGEPQRQVGSPEDVAPGSFFVDYDSDRLVLGSDPSGKQVRASALAKAISIQSGGSAVRGIGVRRFAPSVPSMGAVTVESSGISIENVVIEQTSTTGLAVSGPDARLKGITLTGNGMLGASATYADGLSVIDLKVTDNNTEGFNPSPVAGGFKIGRTRTVRVQDSLFEANEGTGLWFDESVEDMTVSGNDVIGNSAHGISVEISARAVIADNVVAENEGSGLKINNTSDVEIWNNSFIGNGRAINIVQDSRRAADGETPGHDPRRLLPDPSMTWINGPVAVRNNVLADATGDCLLCVEDYSEESSAEDMGVTTAGNVFHRVSGSSPAWLVVWSRGAGDPAVYPTLGSFRTATGQATHDLELIGVEVADPVTFRVSDGVGSSGVARPLPGHVAALMRVPSETLLVGPVRG